MKTLVIVVHGNSEKLREALAAAVIAVEEVNQAPVYRAYIKDESGDNPK